ncbi:isopeptide-forming domain-containing fimbrial protein [Aerococcaceae bacterium DSM 109652]|uniref:Isopeptide-forming domain-containing fimbrial protein n=2 Tax=Fundicoccus ignavus TaxID=2664442 RepID=A0A844C0C2_9LACT|nr:isopeptide-forming domain-containing fimbrial protein [Fundicoccus ignavus]
MLLVLTMILGVNTAFAETTTSNTLTLKNTGATNHTFEIYQVFKGDVSTDSKTLSNIQWGNGVTNTTGIAETVAADLTTTNAQAFADSLTLGTATATSTLVPAGGSYTFSNLDAGYYLVKDVAETQNGVENGASTLYILKVVGTVTAETKLSVPTVEKKVMDANDTTGEATTWADTADHDMGDEVPFQLKGTLPTNYAQYTTYKYVFHDTLSTGLTFNADSVKVFVDGAQITTGYTVDTTNGLNITFADLKQIPTNSASKITVEYTARLNEEAVIGSPGNPNEVYLEYSNNPNNGGEGETGKTPKDNVIVFTYKTIINKVDQDKNPLEGAKFKLEKKVGDEFVGVDRLTISEDKTSFSFNGLDDGTYRLTETETPNGYNTIEPIEFIISAEHSDQTLSLGTVTGTDTKEVNPATFTSDNGTLTTDIVNKAGVTLPSTGGMGTTLLYTVGGVLFLVAIGYYLYDRKKASDKKNK